MESVTNGQLYEWYKEMESLNGSLFAILLRGRIKDFKSANGLRITTLVNKATEIYDNYYQRSADGKIYLADKEGNAILIEGKTQQEFDDEWKELMSRKVSVLI